MLNADAERKKVMFSQSREDFKDNGCMLEIITKAEKCYGNKDYAAAIVLVNQARRQLIDEKEFDFKDMKYINLCNCLGRVLNEYAKAKKEEKKEEARKETTEPAENA